MDAGSPRKSAQFVSNTSPTSARTFNCASYSFFGNADSRNEVTLESPHSADAAWPSKVAVAKTKSAPPTGLESSDSGPDTTPEVQNPFLSIYRVALLFVLLIFGMR